MQLTQPMHTHDHRAMRPLLHALCLFLAVVWLSGCFVEGLGGICSWESDCEKGLRCLEPESEAFGVCTVGCDRDNPCEDSGALCVSVDDEEFGYICLQRCSTNNDCDTEQVKSENSTTTRQLRCLEVRERDDGVCWF